MPNNRSVRYAIKWEVKNDGKCIGQVTSNVFVGAGVGKSIEESKFQITVEKNIVRLSPTKGRETFQLPEGEEYEKLLVVAKSFYVGANKCDDFYYWETRPVGTHESIFKMNTSKI